MASDKISMSPVSKTLFIPLSARAEDAKKKKPILGDAQAIDILDRTGGSVYPRSVMDDMSFHTVVMRGALMDRWTTRFLAAHPEATVLHLACGLDTRAHRMSESLHARVRWIDADVHEVVDLRRRVLPNPDVPDYRLVAASVTDPAFLESVPNDRPTMVVMEGLLPYLTEQEARDLLLRIAERFPSGEVVFDVCGRVFASVSFVPHYILRLGGLFGFTTDDGDELARVSPRLHAGDNVKITRLPGYELCPWYMRYLATLVDWIPFLRSASTLCRFEIR